jgi:hypothetical protein
MKSKVINLENGMKHNKIQLPELNGDHIVLTAMCVTPNCIRNDTTKTFLFKKFNCDGINNIMNIDVEKKDENNHNCDTDPFIDCILLYKRGVISYSQAYNNFKENQFYRSHGNITNGRFCNIHNCLQEDGIYCNQYTYLTNKKNIQIPDINHKSLVDCTVNCNLTSNNISNTNATTQTTVHHISMFPTVVINISNIKFFYSK